MGAIIRKIAEDEFLKIKESVYYDFELKDLFWNVSRGGVRKGQRAGWGRKSRLGRRSVEIFGRSYEVNRLIFMLVNDKILGEDEYIDHIDGDPSNNDHNNLRVVTAQQNVFNNISKGYYYHIRIGKYAASIRINGVLKHLGYFEDEALARKAYVEAKNRYHAGFVDRQNKEFYGKE